MPTYILMTKLSPEVSSRMKERGQIGRQWLDKVKEMCPEVKFIAHYFLLGRFDFLDIYEAPSEEVAARVSMISLAHGAIQSESWTAIPYKKFLEFTKDL